MKTIQEFIKQNKIEMNYTKILRRTDGITWGVNHWEFTLKYGNKYFSGQFSGGSGVKDITCDDVLDSLRTDATFYDTEPKDDLFLVERCKHTKEKLIKFLGEDKFNELVYEVEPL